VADWFEAGLRFACTRCGNCCSSAAGTGGSVRVSDAEIRLLAARLELAEEAFRAIYTRGLQDGATSLRERPEGDCVFLERGVGCAVYADRPRQCRTWPFWRGVVASPAHWRAAGEECPGIGTGALHDAGAIRAARDADGTSGTVPGPTGVDERT
jgi:Fe-S-cluster containining protein